ncbi:hypothetical protein, partial [Enterobacter hormaechei]|uniref:hypothetical protein n=1 Tax=Enterobacter hormaechei TaxID=158836 RepID=UPI0019531337
QIRGAPNALAMISASPMRDGLRMKGGQGASAYCPSHHIRPSARRHHEPIAHWAIGFLNAVSIDQMACLFWKGPKRRCPERPIASGNSRSVYS